MGACGLHRLPAIEDDRRVWHPHAERTRRSATGSRPPNFEVGFVEINTLKKEAGGPRATAIVYATDDTMARNRFDSDVPKATVIARGSKSIPVSISRSFLVTYQ